jgi:hypothetical protein
VREDEFGHVAAAEQLLGIESEFPASQLAKIRVQKNSQPGATAFRYRDDENFRPRVAARAPAQISAKDFDHVSAQSFNLYWVSYRVNTMRERQLAR